MSSPADASALLRSPCFTWAFTSGVISECEQELFGKLPPDLPLQDIEIPVLLARNCNRCVPPAMPIGVVVTSYPGRAELSTYLFFRSLSDSFVRQSVRHLCLYEINSPQAMLEICLDTVDLSLTPASPALFRFVEVMPLQRLATNLGGLLGDNFRTERLTHPAFARITHLTLFDNMEKVTWEDWAALALLPALTHLCLSDTIPLPLLHGVLAHCPTLTLFLNQWRDLEEVQPQEYCELAGVTDVRFVMLETAEWVHEWELGARGCEDMWDRAEAFVADKRCGRIPELQFWLFAGLWEADLDSDSESGDAKGDSEFCALRGEYPTLAEKISESSSSSKAICNELFSPAASMITADLFAILQHRLLSEY